MSRDKQTEIANDLNMHCVSLSEQFCGEMSCNACISNWLYNAGYRKVVEQSETARECQEGVDNGFSSSVTESATRAKVAEEIFAEIEEKIDFNLSMISKIAAAKGGRANGKTILWAKHDVYTEMKEDIAELKKKYIGKDTNVTTNTEN